MSTAPPPLSEADYEAIESAVMETVRGRWFLAEHVRRNRHADTTMLLAALDRIEAAIRGEAGVDAVDRIRFDIVDMAKAISRTKAEIAAIKPDADHQGKFGEATEELDSIVQATEHATSDILAAAEQVQEVAWTLREQGMEAEVCDVLDGRATDIYTACSFQDLTGQRTQKVVQVLRYLEGRINAMIKIWGLDGAMAAEAAERERAREDAHLLSGPARPGHGLDQSDVDVVMRPAGHAGPPAAPAEAPATVEPETAAAPPEVAPVEEAVEPAPVPEPVAVAASPAEPVAPPLQPAAETPAQAPAVSAASELSPGSLRGDPLAAISALSYEEKIALFT
jgi:chemotaxis regulatin CheY-phosphate phosphatase CheZ